MVQNLFHFLISIALPIPTALGRSGKPPTSPRAALGCAWLRLAALGAVVVADKGPRGENAAAWAFWRNKGPDYT